jgi:hypothetical protein
VAGQHEFAARADGGASFLAVAAESGTGNSAERWELTIVVRL